jgi:hypothetical protein
MAEEGFKRKLTAILSAEMTLEGSSADAFLN